MTRFFLHISASGLSDQGECDRRISARSCYYVTTVAGSFKTGAGDGHLLQYELILICGCRCLKLKAWLCSCLQVCIDVRVLATLGRSLPEAVIL